MAPHRYSVSAGLALGLLALGRGRDERGLGSLRPAARLTGAACGGGAGDPSHAPGATLALGLVCVRARAPPPCRAGVALCISE